MVVGSVGRGSRERLVELTPSQTRSLLGVAADIFSQSGGYIDPQTLSGGIWLSDDGAVLGRPGRTAARALG